jgi:hypothetical protein
MKSVQEVRCNWLALPLLLVAAGAQATEIRDPTVSSNPTINNSTVPIEGKLILDANERFDRDCGDTSPENCLSVPWTIRVFAGSAPFNDPECLRLDLTHPAPQDEDTSTDLQIVVIDPFGRVFRNNNRSSGDFRPLVKIRNAQEGWYTVIVQRAFDETGRTFFTLRYGRYNSGNVNCANPTQPLVSQQAAAMGLTGEQEAAAATAAWQERRKAVRAN